MVGIKNNRYETDNIVSTLGTVETTNLLPVEIRSTTELLPVEIHWLFFYAKNC